MKSDLVDVDVHVHRNSSRAILVSPDGESDSAVWLPLSAIEISMRRGSAVLAVATMTEQLAIEKGLV